MDDPISLLTDEEDVIENFSLLPTETDEESLLDKLYSRSIFPNQVPKELLDEKVVNFITKNFLYKHWYFLTEYVTDEDIIYSLYDEYVKYLPENKKNDKEFLKKLGKRKIDVLILIPLNDKELYHKEEVIWLVKRIALFLHFTYKSEIDEELCDYAMESNPKIFSELDEKFHHFDFVFRHVRKHSSVYLNIKNEKVKNDLRIITHTLQVYDIYFNIPYETKMHNPELTLIAYENKYVEYENIPTFLKKDPEFIQKLVKINPYLVISLENPDQELIKFAISFNGMVLEYYEEYQNDFGVVLSAISKTPKAIQFASEELRNNRMIAYDVVSRNGMMIMHLSDDLQADWDIMLSALSQNLNASKFADPNLLKTMEFQLLIDKMYYRLTSTNAYILKSKDIKFWFH